MLGSTAPSHGVFFLMSMRKPNMYARDHMLRLFVRTIAVPSTIEIEYARRYPPEGLDNLRADDIVPSIGFLREETPIFKPRKGRNVMLKSSLEANTPFVKHSLC